jgi:TolB protein
MLTRRRVMTAITSFGIAAAMASCGVRAEGLVQHPVLKEYPPIRIAIPSFVAGAAGDETCAAEITQVITDDLRRSGQFVSLDPSTFVERVASFDAVPQFPRWIEIKAEELITGRTTRQADGRLKVEFRLWGVASGQQLIGWHYVASPDDWRSVGHIIADAIIAHMTGKTAEAL